MSGHNIITIGVSADGLETLLASDATVEDRPAPSEMEAEIEIATGETNAPMAVEKLGRPSEFTNKVIGIITDRDIAIAAATKGSLASEILVGEVISRKVFSATLDEDIHMALKTMRHEKIRRLPVVNLDGMLQGILSLNDIALRAEEEEGRRHPELTYEGAMGTFKAVCEHRSARRAAA
jgi:CBS domain-containing protein